MKLGISSYSLYQAMQQKRMDILQVIEWIAEQKADHVELVPELGFDIEQEGLIEQIREKTQSLDLDISNYAVGGNFASDDDREIQAELGKVFRHVDIAHQLGVDRMRHDVMWLPASEATTAKFEADFEKLVSVCRQVADYASQYGITTSIENHGYHVQTSERVLRLLHAVDRENFKITIDIGNFMVADENSAAAVKKVIPYASMVHFKDFYFRPAPYRFHQNWMPTIAGNYVRGAVFGYGNIDTEAIGGILLDAGYDGPISIEFEGHEDCLYGTSLGMDNARKLLNKE